jgi:cell division protein FtsQ
MEVRQYINHVIRFLPVVVIGIVFLQLINKTNFSALFPVKNVRIYGIRHIDHEEVQSLIMPALDRGFFGVDVDFIRDRLQQLSWVGNIFIRRHWPDRIEVAIVEKEAVAKWNHVGLLSSAGDIFTPSKESYPKDIPDFLAPEGTQVQILQYYQAINRILLPLHAKISYLELTPYATWKVRMNNGLLLLVGNRQLLTELNHFVKVYPKIIGAREHDVESVDLRYSNGVAIRWKDPIK